MKKTLRYIIIFTFLIFCRGILAQNVKTLHYNLFTSENSTEVKHQKNVLVKSILHNLEADIYSFSENPNKKSMLDKAAALKGTNRAKYKYASHNTSDFYHFLVYNSFKISILESKNIHTKSKPILFYRFSHVIPNFENKFINCFVIRPEDAGHQLVEIFNKISGFIMERNLSGYSLIIGGTDNIRIEDKRIIANTLLDFQDSIRIAKLSTNLNEATPKTISSIELSFDMAFHIEKISNKTQPFRFIPDSYTLLTKNSSSFYIEMRDEFIDSMIAISAHIPIYFELEPLREEENNIVIEKLSFSRFVTTDLTLTLNWPQEELMYIYLKSIIGNIIYQTSLICPPTEYEVDIPMSSLPPGQYLLEIKTDSEDIIRPIEKY